MGKDLRELLGYAGPLTHRQYLAWQRWLDEQWNEPSRSDYYAMQVAAAVMLKGHEAPEDFRLSNLRIPFEDVREAVAEREYEEAPESVAARDKAFFVDKVRGMGGVTIQRVSPEEQARLDALPEWEAAQERRRLAKEAKRA